VMDLPPSQFYDVLDSLILDLEKVQSYALTRYPETKPEYQTGRITKCAIWAMLCEMYLWKQDYDNCIKYADLVIEDKKNYVKERRGQGQANQSSYGNTDSRFNGYPLIDCRNGAYEAIFIDGNSQETIFELPFDKADPGYSRLGNSAVGRLYGSSDYTSFIKPSNTVAEDGSKSSQRVIYADRNKSFDSRIYWNANGDNNYGSISKYAYQMVTISGSSSITGISHGLYSYAKVNNVDHFSNSSPWIIYRLTDIMLLKAEALSQKLREGTDQAVLEYNAPLLAEAFSLVNAVNKRALYQVTLTDTLLASAYSTKSLMEDLVMQERHRELMFEGKRWFDIVRRCLREGNTNAACNAVARRSGLNAQYVLNTLRSPLIGMWAIFLPYNDEETKVNLNLAANQNPAFDSGESSISK